MQALEGETTDNPLIVSLLEKLSRFCERADIFFAGSPAIVDIKWGCQDISYENIKCLGIPMPRLQKLKCLGIKIENVSESPCHIYKNIKCLGIPMSRLQKYKMSRNKNIKCLGIPMPRQQKKYKMS